MRSFPTLLLLGAAQALSWVIPDESNQRIFEVFETPQGKPQSRLQSSKPCVEGSREVDVSYVDNALKEYMISCLQTSQVVEYSDAASRASYLDSKDDDFTVENKKHRKKKSNGHKHRDGKHHKDKHSDDDHRQHRDHYHGDGCHCGEPEEPPHPRPPMPPSDPHGPHTNSTIWELISSSKHSRFAELIKKDHEVMEMLNDKKANVTVFAPNNHAFAMLDKFLKHKDIPKDLIHRVLMYHIAPGTHESQDLRYHNTLMTELSDDDLGKDVHQRLRIGLNHKGPNINFYSQFTVFDIYCNNGVIHAIDAILFPPPDILDLIEILPTEFSTTEAALERTGLLEELSKLSGNGLTIFAPSNRDWKKLGLKLNAWLFSKCGTKYLRALMMYHISPNCTLYSDALVCPGERKDNEEDAVHVLNELDDPDGLLHGYTHVYLPTMLDERHISVDINRWERWLSFRVNGLSAIAISDGIAKSGSIQVPDHVLIPPHSMNEHPHPSELLKSDGGDELERGQYSVRQLKAILEPFVAQAQEKLDELRAHRSQRGGEL